MLLKRTVLVLAAGASAPYGFPTGQQLIKEISLHFEEYAFATGTRDAVEIRRRMAANEFVRSLQLSDPSSIDVFLEHNPPMSEFGKEAIASVLLRIEQEEALFDWNEERRKDHWYQYLWDRLSADGADNFGKAPLKIVTFNYDRSLEHYLFVVIRNMFHMGPEAAGQVLKRLPITHVHGQLGRLPWQDGQDPPVPYGPDAAHPLGETIANATKGIRIISDDISMGVALRQAQEYLRDAQVIAFLGFGYLPLNLERLFKRIEYRADTITITGTCSGFTEAERQQKTRHISQLVGRMSTGWQYVPQGPSSVPNLGSGFVDVHLRDQRNLQFLRDSPYLFRD